jgi:hypothetical protein
LRDADEPEDHHHHAPAVHALAEQQRRKQRHPHRHGEFDGEHGRERQRADRIDPAQLTGDMRQRTHQEDLERAHLAQQLAHRDGHPREGDERAPHPQGGANRVA